MATLKKIMIFQLFLGVTGRSKCKSATAVGNVQKFDLMQKT